MTINTGVKMLWAAIVLVGLGGILGQLVLLREMLVTFYGNELTMGVILANWLAGDCRQNQASRFIYRFAYALRSDSSDSYLLYTRFYASLLGHAPG